MKLSDGRLFRRTRWANNMSSVDSNLNPVIPCVPGPKIGNGVTGTVMVEQAVMLSMASTGTVMWIHVQLFSQLMASETSLYPKQMLFVIRSRFWILPIPVVQQVRESRWRIESSGCQVKVYQSNSPRRGVTRSSHCYAKLDQPQ